MSDHRRCVIVTGAGSGIGRAIALRFAAAGDSVVAADVDETRAAAVDREISAAGGSALAVRADVTVAGDVAQLVETALEAAGSVDVLVNNAGHGAADDLLEIDEETWQREVDLNLTGPFLCTKAVLPAMIERGSGAIVNIASVNGLAFFANEAYSAAKAGLINLTQSIAVRYGPLGIRANSIAPGTVRTPIWQERLDSDPAIFERLVKWYPLGRVGEPEDIAAAAFFLASDDASWITGSVLRVDGGLLAGSARMARELVADAAGEEV
jgi:meso-butanediol dehydrogenase/(S,S)-butanediol dehydrogenase/diacetyl reductase